MFLQNGPTLIQNGPMLNRPELFNLTLAVHLIFVVLGVGQVAALAIASSDAELRIATALKSFTTVQWSLVAVVLTGGGLDLLAPGPGRPDQHLYLKLVFLLTLAIGYPVSVGRRILKRAEAPLSATDLGRLRRASRCMVGIVAVVVVLLATQPG